MAVSLKDMTTGQHLLRVRKFVEAISGQLGLPPATIEEFGYSSILHDVGKIGIPDGILQKPGPLSVAERRRMQTHTVLGEAMLSG
jgi:putative two-component system response regulator